MINMLLLDFSKKSNVFYMEKRNYNQGRVYKTYIVKHDNKTKEFKSKYELLTYLSKRR